MTDTRLQELKRAWEASGSVEDEAAYLRERVRVGDLTQERLELAAFCGHEAAAHELGVEPLEDVEAWLEFAVEAPFRQLLAGLAVQSLWELRIPQSTDLYQLAILLMTRDPSEHRGLVAQLATSVRPAQVDVRHGPKGWWVAKLVLNLTNIELAPRESLSSFNNRRNALEAAIQLGIKNRETLAGTGLVLATS